MRLMMILLIIASTASAAVPGNPDPIDSSASGVYLGADRVCRIVLYRHQVMWTQVDIRCLHFAGTQTVSLTTVYTNGVCGPLGVAYMLNPWPPEVPREYLNLRSYDGTDQTLQIVRGTDQTAVTNGIGTAEAWYRIGWAPSPAPYSCTPAAVSNKPRG